MTAKDYWAECLSNAADECGVKFTPEQLSYLAEACDGAHDNYGMAFYSPPSTDRIREIEREWKARLAAKERELEGYRMRAETAIKEALRQSRDAVVSIGEHGEVFRHGGRTVQIQ